MIPLHKHLRRVACEAGVYQSRGGRFDRGVVSYGREGALVDMRVVMGVGGLERW